MQTQTPMVLRNLLVPIPLWESIKNEASSQRISASALIRLVMSAHMLGQTAPLRIPQRKARG